jgi:sialic acid synthase SpsE
MKVHLSSNIYIGDNEPIQIIGEIGQNHNGSMENAKKLIDMSDLCGIKLVKFQKRDIATEFTTAGYNRPYDNPNSFGKIYGEHREFLELNKEQHKELKDYANNKGLIYFCTPCDIPSLKIMEEIGCPFYKVASRDITNIPLLEELGKLNKTVIISTGMAEYDDINLALKTLNLPMNKVIIMQCTSEYPCPPKSCNLNVITTYKKKYKNVIGFSDHTNGILAPTISAILGARIIEKHITLNRSMKGTDQAGSCEITGLSKLQKYVSTIPIMLGSSEKKLEDNVTYSKHKLMKSITSKIDIKKDTVITKDMLCLKCPGDGILWKNVDNIIGKKVKYDIPKDTTIRAYDFYQWH